MSVVSTTVLKSYFETGDFPTQQNFIDLIDTIGGDWTDYSATSTIVGWSSYTTKQIYYKRTGTTVYIQFYITGTSNATTTSFTIPFTASSVMTYQVNNIKALNNGTDSTSSFAQLPASSSIISFYRDMTPTAWTGSGTKLIMGQLMVQL